MKITFKQHRETPGTFVYAECDSKGVPFENKKDAVIGSLYIRKSSEIGKKESKQLIVTIEAK